VLLLDSVAEAQARPFFSVFYRPSTFHVTLSSLFLIMGMQHIDESLADLLNNATPASMLKNPVSTTECTHQSGRMLSMDGSDFSVPSTTILDVLEQKNSDEYRRLSKLGQIDQKSEIPWNTPNFLR